MSALISSHDPLLRVAIRSRDASGRGPHGKCSRRLHNLTAIKTLAPNKITILIKCAHVDSFFVLIIASSYSRTLADSIPLKMKPSSARHKTLSHYWKLIFFPILDRIMASHYTVLGRPSGPPGKRTDVFLLVNLYQNRTALK